MIVRLRVGGFTLRAQSQTKAASARFRREYRPFFARRGSDISIEIVRQVPILPPSGDLLFESGGLWRVHRLGEKLLYSVQSPDGLNSADRALLVNTDRSQGTLYLAPSRWSRITGYALSFPLGELLFQHHAARAYAFFVHACGVVLKDKILLFCGQSGSGKTTTAQLWRRYRKSEILSDDRILVRSRRDIPWGYGTPWHGSGRYSSPDGYPVAAVFFLEHAAKTNLVRLDLSQATATLFARAFAPVWEGETVQRVLQCCERVASVLPCYSFGFSPNHSAVAAVEAFMKEI